MIARKFVKLVRDAIPERFPELVVRYAVVDRADRRRLLEGKLIEEVMEYVRDPCISELADISEVVEALAREHEGGGGVMGKLALLRARREKTVARGGYRACVGMYVEGEVHGDGWSPEHDEQVRP